VPRAVSFKLGEVQSARAQIDWTKLPDDKHPPVALLDYSDPIQRVHATLRVDMAERKKSGVAWDAFDGLPDIAYRASIVTCDGGEGFGTSASTPGIAGLAKDTLTGNWALGDLSLRRGMHFEVEVTDRDVSADDRVGTFDVVSKNRDDRLTRCSTERGSR
jgi:hypothetical protein